MLRLRTVVSLYVTLALALAGCGGEDNGGGGPSNSLVVSPQVLNLADCEQGTLTATLLDSDGNPVPGAQVSFSSSSSIIAAVSPAGVVTANGVGSTSIIVTSGQLKDTIPVSVALGPITISAAPDSINLDRDGVRAILATVLNCHGSALPNPVITTSTLDAGVATAANDLIFGEGPGLTKVAFTSGTESDTVIVNVYSPSHPGTGLTTLSTTGNPFGIALSGSGQLYFTKLQSAVIARDTLPFTSPITQTFPVGTFPTDVAFVPRQLKAVVTNQGDNTVGLIDVRTHAQTGTLGLSANPFRVLNAPNNRTYVTLSVGVVMVFNSTTNARLDSIVVDPAPNGLALSPDASVLYVSSTTSGRITVISASTNTVVNAFTVGGTLQDLEISPDGLTLYAATEGLGVQRIDVGTQTAIDTLLMPAFGMKLTPDGAQLFVVGSSTLTIIDRATFTAAPGIDLGGNARRVAFGRGGRLAVVSNESGGYASVLE